MPRKGGCGGGLGRAVAGVLAAAPAPERPHATTTRTPPPSAALTCGLHAPAPPAPPLGAADADVQPHAPGLHHHRAHRNHLRCHRAGGLRRARPQGPREAAAGGGYARPPHRRQRRRPAAASLPECGGLMPSLPGPGCCVPRAGFPPPAAFPVRRCRQAGTLCLPACPPHCEAALPNDSAERMPAGALSAKLCNSLNKRGAVLQAPQR